MVYKKSVCNEYRINHDKTQKALVKKTKIRLLVIVVLNLVNASKFLIYLLKIGRCKLSILESKGTFYHSLTALKF